MEGMGGGKDRTSAGRSNNRCCRGVLECNDAVPKEVSNALQTLRLETSSCRALTRTSAWFVVLVSHPNGF